MPLHFHLSLNLRTNIHDLSVDYRKVIIVIKFSISMFSAIRDFVPLQKLGKGSFASVYKVKRNADSQIYALKKIKMTQMSAKVKENALNEVRLLASLKSPYIISYNQAFFDEPTDSLCIVMEYADQGDLREKIEATRQQKKITPQIQIWKVLIHLLQGLKVLHENHILHRDLKCENIMVSQQTYKIGDMNVSIINKRGLVETQTGTPYYASPEVWKDQPYNQQSDMWSVGCILYELSTLRPPFTGTTLNQLYKNVMRGCFNPIPKIYSNELANIISRCLRLNPNERPTAPQLLQNWTLKLYENICVDYKVSSQPVSVNLLKTIMMPKNIKQLNSILPKSNYTSEHSSKCTFEHNSKCTTEHNSNYNIQPNIDYTKRNQTPFNQDSPKLHSVKPCNNPVQPQNKQKRESALAIHPRAPHVAIKHQKTSSSSKIQKEPVNQANAAIKGAQSDTGQMKEMKPIVKACSLQQVDFQNHRNPQEKQPSEQSQHPRSLKSLQEIQSFNRLIQRIKSTSKKATASKTEKQRRTLKEISNKIAPVRSRSKSMKRTERSMSREVKNELRQAESQAHKKMQYTDRPHLKAAQNMPKRKGGAGQNEKVDYRKVLDSAREMLSRRLVSQKQQFF